MLQAMFQKKIISGAEVLGEVVPLLMTHAISERKTIASGSGFPLR